MDSDEARLIAKIFPKEIKKCQYQNHGQDIITILCEQTKKLKINARVKAYALAPVLHQIKEEHDHDSIHNCIFKDPTQLNQSDKIAFNKNIGFTSLQFIYKKKTQESISCVFFLCCHNFYLHNLKIHWSPFIA
ncbi:hypothetical protein [Leuconostoc mesenteroides]|uniref:hypothetical protein n=1 Tax=Leuconostoc mesenteroides TaxID=1245 RepID=UPI002360FBC2|nr:hypothetical protein [Leuconostoc mesenteroides]